MYIPASLREERTEKLHEWMRQYSFATLVSNDAHGLFATHLPFVLDTERGPLGTLRAHLARANPHWKQFQEGDREALVIFQGPHAYISPGWYEAQPSVPTWNYVVVHAYGAPRLLDDAALYAVLRASIEQYDPNPAQALDLPEDYVQKMMRGIVGIEIEITRLEGKVKMNQNRSETDQERVIAALEATADPHNAEVAAWMREL